MIALLSLLPQVLALRVKPPRSIGIQTFALVQKRHELLRQSCTYPALQDQSVSVIGVGKKETLIGAHTDSKPGQKKGTPSQRTQTGDEVPNVTNAGPARSACTNSPGFLKRLEIFKTI